MNIERTIDVDRGNEIVNSHNMKHWKVRRGSQFNMQTLKRNISGKLRSQIGNVFATVKTGVYETTLYAIDILVIPNMEIAKRSVINSQHVTL